MPRREKTIAVIGSGISGLAAAYLLSRRHRVHLFEKELRLGGHTNTVVVEGATGAVALDTGFLVHNDRTYLNLVRLFGELGVATRDLGHVLRGVLRRSGLEASVDVLPSSGITLVLLTNLQSAVTWQLRAQLKNLLQRKPTTAIQRAGPVRPRFEPTSSFVGRYGSQSFSIEVSEVEGKLYRDGNEFYPIDGERYCIPASGAIM